MFFLEYEKSAFVIYQGKYLFNVACNFCFEFLHFEKSVIKFLEERGII